MPDRARANKQFKQLQADLQNQARCGNLVSLNGLIFFQ